MSEKILILVRHAHRDTSERELDNGLSKRGREQAKEILKAFEAHWERDFAQTGPDSIALLSSPKKRCIETLEPISQRTKVSVQISPLLDEQQTQETAAAMLRRIEQFRAWWEKEAPPLTLVCSHGDWLPVCTEELMGTPVGFEKGAWIVVGLQSGANARPQLKARRP